MSGHTNFTASGNLTSAPRAQEDPPISYPSYLAPSITYAGTTQFYANYGSGGGGGSNINTWAYYPALQPVDMSGNNIFNANEILFKSDVDNILSVNGDNDLTYNGSVLQVGGTTPSEWANYPALADIQMATSSIKNVSSILIGSETTNILAVNEANELTYNGDVLAVGGITPAEWANYPAVANVDIDNRDVLKTGRVLFKSDTTNILTTNESNQLTYNGAVLNTGGSVDLSQWATLPAVANVVMGSNVITTTTTTGITANPGGLSATVPTINLTSGGGFGGVVNVTADAGYAGVSYGRVSINANGGSTGDIITGGLVEINANTPVGVVPTASSAVKISAAGINSYAGAIPSIGSLAGYNFIYGTAGVNICAGTPSVLPNTGVTTYLYGANGIELNSDVYTTSIQPFWNGITVDVAPLVIKGRPAVPLIHGEGVVMLENVSTINGAVYPPPGSGWVGTATSALDMSNYGITNISTLTGVSTINGAVYPPTAPAISVPATSVLFSTDGTTITGDSNMTFAVEGQRLTANNITASFDLTINSDASLTVGGSTGSAGKVVAITTGDYPVWSFPPPPSVISITLNGIDTVTEVPDLGRYYPVDTDVGGTNYTIVFDVTAVAGGTSWYIKNVTTTPVSIRYDAGAGITDATYFGGAVALTPEQGYSVCSFDGATLTIY